MFFLKWFKSFDRGYMDALTQAGTIGLHMASGVAVGGLIGYGLDRWLETHPWGVLIFLCVGVAAGFRNVYLDTKKLVRRQQLEDEERFAKKVKEERPPAERKPEGETADEKRPDGGTQG